MAKNSDSSLVGLLEIPLVACRSGSTRKMAFDLHEVAKQLNRARNAIVRAWQRWREDHPDWQPELPRDKDGQVKRRKNGKLAYPQNALAPETVTQAGETGEWEKVRVPGKTKKKFNRYTKETVVVPVFETRRRGDRVPGQSFENYLYHVGRAAAPQVSSAVMSLVAKEVLSNLQTSAIHQHAGVHLYRWQAILDHDSQATCFQAKGIPIPNNAAGLCYGGKAVGGRKSSEELRLHGASAAVVEFPLWSKESGRRDKCALATINVGSLPCGNRKIVQRIASGEWKWSDSKLIFKKNRWQLQLTYKQPSHSLELDPSGVATLWPMFPEAPRPFAIESKERNRHWFSGHGLWLQAEFQRLRQRRLALRNRYREHGLSGMKGHGRKRFELRLRPHVRRTQNLERQFCRQLVKEVVRFCQMHDCGKVVYREPHLQTRDHLWLASQEVPCDWTALLGDLSHTLRYYSIELVVVPVNGRELRERFGADPAVTLKNERNSKPDSEDGGRNAETASRKTKVDTEQMVTSNGIGKEGDAQPKRKTRSRKPSQVS